MCVDKKLFHWLCVGWLGHFPCVKAFPCFYFLFFFFLMIKNYLYIQSVHFSCLLSLWCSKVLTYSFLSFLCAECTCTKCLFYFILQFNKPNTLIRSVYFGLVICLIEIKFIFLWTAFFFFAPNCDLYVRQRQYHHVSRHNTTCIVFLSCFGCYEMTTASGETKKNHIRC